MPNMSGWRSSASRTSASPPSSTAMAGEERVIVSDVAGTTRDADRHGRGKRVRQIRLHRHGRASAANRRSTEEIERYSVLRAYMAVDRSDVCVIMLDATVGFTEQDSKVAGYAHEQGKGCIVAVNKWDAVDKDGRTMQEYRKKLENGLLLHVLRALHLHLRQDGPADRQALRADQFRQRPERDARPDRAAQRHALLRDGAGSQPPTDKGKRLQYLLSAPRPPPGRRPSSSSATTRSSSTSPTSATSKTRSVPPSGWRELRCASWCASGTTARNDPANNAMRV